MKMEALATTEENLKKHPEFAYLANNHVFGKLFENGKGTIMIDSVDNARVAFSLPYLVNSDEFAAEIKRYLHDSGLKLKQTTNIIIAPEAAPVGGYYVRSEEFDEMGYGKTILDGFMDLKDRLFSLNTYLNKEKANLLEDLEKKRSRLEEIIEFLVPTAN